MEDALASANCIVQWVDTSNDIGRDAFVELVSGTDVVGSIVCVQVKSGTSYCYDCIWSIPGREADFTLWRESTVPMFGITHSPDDDSLRWVELTALERGDGQARVVLAGYGKSGVETPDSQRLDLDPDAFVKAARRACERMRGLPVEGLLSGEPARVEAALLDLFTLGRTDPVPLGLLASLVSKLPEETVSFAIRLLSHATSHPDIAWSIDNWVEDSVKARLRRGVKWHAEDVVCLLRAVGDDGFLRGSMGQSVYHVLDLDQQVDARLFEVCVNPGRGARTSGREHVRSLAACVLCYHAAEDAPEVLRRLTAAAPDLAAIPMIRELKQLLYDHGWVDIF